jgi:hypothetical protein
MGMPEHPHPPTSLWLAQGAKCKAQCCINQQAARTLAAIDPDTPRQPGVKLITARLRTDAATREGKAPLGESPVRLAIVAGVATLAPLHFRRF